MTTTLKHVLEAKPEKLAVVGPGDSVLKALSALIERKIGAVLVMDGNNLVGIVSERDLVHKVLAKGKSPASTRVSEVMTEKPYCASLADTVGSCMALMTERRFRHLPVIDDQRRVIGIVSIGDLVKAVQEEQAFMIDQFQRYVYSGGY